MGHTDHGGIKQSEFWEISDGAMRTVSQISYIDPNLVLDFIPTIIEIVYFIFSSFSLFYLLLNSNTNKKKRHHYLLFLITKHY